MSRLRAILEAYNNELLKQVEKLHRSKKEIEEQSVKLIEDLLKIHNNIVWLNKILKRRRERLLWYYDLQNKLYDILINGMVIYDKIFDSSKTLVIVLQKEIENLYELIELIEFQRIFIEE